MSAARARALECLVLFVLLPLLLAAQGELLRRWILPQLFLFAAFCLWRLRRDPAFEWRALWAWPAAWRPCLGRILAALVGGGALLWALAWALPAVEPFAFPREQPALWAAVLLFYPLLSALPQELIFRVFFFQRYRALFVSPWALSLASATTFALAHLLLGNLLAVALSFLGGLLFAWTYAKTRSLLLVALEHGLWGDWLFTLGFGRYFYGGHL